MSHASAVTPWDVSTALASLRTLLANHGHWQQAAIVEEALLVVDSGDEEQLQKRIGAADIWGSAGSVVDVQLGSGTGNSRDTHDDENAFYAALDVLGTYLEQSGIATPGIISILGSIREFLRGNLPPSSGAAH